MRGNSPHEQSELETIPLQRLSKVGLRKTEKHTEYATETFVRDSLKTIEARYCLPVSQALSFLREGRVDSISLSKETPYINFHAIRLRESIRITVKDGREDMELELTSQDQQRM